MKFKNIDDKYLTAEPWKIFTPIDIYIFPSVIGLTYLLSLEVSFSLWFFYFLQKIVAFTAVKAGWGKTHADFQKEGLTGDHAFLMDQGTGALIAMVLFGFWMSRTHLADVFLKALGLRARSEEDSGEALSHRGAVLMFVVCFVGASVWLTKAGLSTGYALLAIVIFLIIMIGITRLACEGGLFYVQTQADASNLLQLTTTAETMGPAVMAPLGIWARIFAFDWGRTSPMPAMMNSLKLSSDMRLLKGPMTVGIFLAIIASLGLTFFTFFPIAYSEGAKGLEGHHRGWTFQSPPQSTMKKASKNAADLNGIWDAADKLFLEKCVELKFCTREPAEKIYTKLVEDRKEAAKLVLLPNIAVREEWIVAQTKSGADWWLDQRRLPGKLIAGGKISSDQAKQIIQTSQSQNPNEAISDSTFVDSLVEAGILENLVPEPTENEIRKAHELQMGTSVNNAGSLEVPQKSLGEAKGDIKKTLWKQKVRNHLAADIYEVQWTALRSAQTNLIETRERRLLHALQEQKLVTAEQAQVAANKIELSPKDLILGINRVDKDRLKWMGFGGVAMVAMMVIRTRLFWFPHPIGYVAWTHHMPMQVLWFSLFLGWCLKWAIVKYGGFNVYTRFRRLFVGLVVGEVLAAAVWILIFGAMDMPASGDFYKINIDP